MISLFLLFFSWHRCDFVLPVFSVVPKSEVKSDVILYPVPGCGVVPVFTAAANVDSGFLETANGVVLVRTAAETVDAVETVVLVSETTIKRDINNKPTIQKHFTNCYILG